MPAALAGSAGGTACCENLQNPCAPCPQVHVDLKHLCMHLVRWRLLNKEFNLPDLAVMVLFAKQEAPHVEDFTLQAHPLWLDYK